MNALTPRDRRLANELEEMKKLAAESPFFRFEADSSEFPERYALHFGCFGLIARPQWGRRKLPPDWRRTPPAWLGNEHMAIMYLPAEYPTAPPQVRMVTPIFHPNIRFLGDNEKEIGRLLEYVGGAENLNRLFRESSEMRMVANELFSAFICLDGLKGPKESGYYTPRLRLRDICVELGQMIMFQRYNTGSPLNKPAAEWTSEAERFAAEDLGDRLPIDNRDFITQEPVVRILPPPKEPDIDISFVGEP